MKTILLEAAIAAVVLLGTSSLYSMKWVILIFGLALPFVVLKPWLYFSRQWIGEIISIECEDIREQKYKSGADTRYTNYHTVTYIVCTVKIENERSVIFKLKQRYNCVYHVGDTVMKISGIDYPVNWTLCEQAVCFKCGATLPQDMDHCLNCGMPTAKITSEGSYAKQ
ncbi:MAG: hypothetical protein E7616_07765 [Ruminococcaceae bacterium]|nr:hypothetical protein [Oscillospiraceae bacterium]